MFIFIPLLFKLTAHIFRTSPSSSGLLIFYFASSPSLSVRPLTLTGICKVLNVRAAFGSDLGFCCFSFSTWLIDRWCSSLETVPTHSGRFRAGFVAAWLGWVACVLVSECESAELWVRDGVTETLCFSPLWIFYCQNSTAGASKSRPVSTPLVWHVRY